MRSDFLSTDKTVKGETKRDWKGGFESTSRCPTLIEHGACIHSCTKLYTTTSTLLIQSISNG